MRMFTFVSWFLAQAAATNSNIIRNDWPQYDFPQIANFNLLDKAYHIAKILV